MPTQAWQSIRSTNAGILVENAKYIKSFQNNLNATPKVPVLFQVGAVWNTITNFSQVSNSQFSLPKGYFLAILNLVVFSPTSQKLQMEVSGELNSIVLQEVGYTSLTIATDQASSLWVAMLRVPVAGQIFEIFGEQSGVAGTLDVVSGELNILRLYNTII